MAFPLIAIGATALRATAAGGWISGLLVTFGLVTLRDQILDKFQELLSEVMQSSTGKNFVTQVVNHSISVAGVDGLVFADIYDTKEVARTMDGFAAHQVNEKLGTTLTGIKGLSKDQLLEGLGGVMAQRINSEAGTSITNIFPVKRFREEISSGVIDQFDTITAGTGAVLTAHGKEYLEKKLLSKMAGYAPPPPTSTYSEAVLAKNRVKQKKYRLTHTAVYVNTSKLAALALANGMTVPQLRNSLGLGDD